MKYVLLAMLLMSPVAKADLSLECKTTSGARGVSLDFAADAWILRDPKETTLRRGEELSPTTQTSKTVTFLYDFGSDHEKRVYSFTGMQKCGIYGDDVAVVTLTTSLKSFDGRMRNSTQQRCSCIED